MNIFKRKVLKAREYFTSLFHTRAYTVSQHERWHESVKLLVEWKAHFNPSFCAVHSPKLCLLPFMKNVKKNIFHRNTSNHSEPLQLMSRFLSEKSHSFWILWLVPQVFIHLNSEIGDYILKIHAI